MKDTFIPHVHIYLMQLKNKSRAGQLSEERYLFLKEKLNQWVETHQAHKAKFFTTNR